MRRKQRTNRTRIVVGAMLFALAAGGFPAIALAGDTVSAGASPDLTRLESANLQTFDDLDFNVFSRQAWDRLGESHSKGIVVHWPDGRTTEGFDAHLEDLKAMFVYAPDTRITAHPVKIASGEWTAVTGVIEGTFSKPMPLGDGKTIPPTGKAFKLSMATIGRWENGVMVEEWLFWDNLSFMKQIGLAE